ncbi:WD40/YVTN/BNR-like repeat-containing protein [Clostridium oryzae]|uniref:Ycf48-like protein n=1 Tax=Clostridium oryzae TaxID=1450648 RepID=A0A1V4IV53_9CLOT|nr:hypothetical protein [Clostridium oryzae]OPJ63783.1 Ycf48-like protein [Clostridium oryzae]
MKKFIILVMVCSLILSACSPNKTIKRKIDSNKNKSKHSVVSKSSEKDKKSNNSNIEMQGFTPIGVKIVRYNEKELYSDAVFINSKIGWKAVYTDCAMFHQPALLYKTINGGKKWFLINSTKKSYPLMSKTGITFLDKQTGWVTTSTPRCGYVGLFRSLDGGTTWKYQHVDVPHKYKGWTLGTYPPVFFSKKDGILIGQEYKEKLLVYVTHDGGKAWKLIAKNSTSGKIKWDVHVNDENLLWTVIYDGVKWKSKDIYRWDKKR